MKKIFKEEDFKKVKENEKIECYVSGRILQENEQYIIINNKTISKKYTDKIYVCDCCGQLLNNYIDEIYNTKKHNFCYNCFSQRRNKNKIHKCSYCSAYIDEELEPEEHKNSYVNIANRYYCQNHKNEGFIMGYSTKPNIEIFKTEGEEITNESLYVGFELEVVNNNSYDDIKNWQIAEKLHNAINKEYCNDRNFIYFKTDGSVNHGFEIVSQPFTEKFFRKNYKLFEKMLSILRDNNCTSHDNDCCGLHFHINKAFLQNKTNIDKLTLFTEYYKDELKVFSRRAKYNYCQFLSDNNNISKNVVCNLKYLEKNNTAYKTSRYLVVNVQPQNTVEIRVFRGTLKFETFMATTEFVYSLAKTVVENEITKINWNKVQNYKKNKFLADYCKSRNIVTSKAYMKDLSLAAIKELNKAKKEMRKQQLEIIEKLLQIYAKIQENTIKLPTSKQIAILAKASKAETKEKKEKDLKIQVLQNNLTLIQKINNVFSAANIDFFMTYLKDFYMYIDNHRRCYKNFENIIGRDDLYTLYLHLRETFRKVDKLTNEMGGC